MEKTMKKEKITREREKMERKRKWQLVWSGL
jgi:hypothetical protein